MPTIGNYEYTFNENDQTRTMEDGTVKAMYTIDITNIAESKTVRLNNISRVIEREDWLKISYNAAVDTLNGTPNCCLTGQVEWVAE
jgi:hypothetical protein